MTMRTWKLKLGQVVGHIQNVQLDIMDGSFVPEKTWPYGKDHKSFERLLSEETGLPFWERVDYEIDLMVSNPEEVISDWITAGAARIIVHVESTKNIPEITRQFREWFAFTPEEEKRDVELGLALNIQTSTDLITEYLEDIDFIQFMGIDRDWFPREKGLIQMSLIKLELSTAVIPVLLFLSMAASVSTMPGIWWK
jgi:ribulose-phosphate 3-epimerase